MQDYTIKQTSVWGDTYKANTPENVLRCGEKRQLLHTSYPFLDHSTLYAFRPTTQRGPTRERQTFIVSYIYKQNYDEIGEARETDFIQSLQSIELRFCKQPCMFRGKDAYRVLILDTEVDLQTVVNLLELNQV
jgi:hypothetical protein